MIPVLAQATKELKTEKDTEIKELKSEIEALKAEIRAIKAAME